MGVKSETSKHGWAQTNSGEPTLPTPPNTWFSVSVSFGVPTLPDNVLHIKDLARRLNRPVATVRTAADDGRIARVEVPNAKSRGRHARNRSVYVHATPADLTTWRLCSFREALAARPDLPQRASAWRTVVEIARHFKLDYRTAQWRVERLQVPLLEWGAGGPFEPERRYFLPRFPRRLGQPPGGWSQKRPSSR